MTTNHDACCCTETLIDLGALKAAYWSTCSAYTAACHERDQARDTAARLQAAYDDTIRAHNDTVLAYGLAIRAYGLASRVGDRLTDKLAAATAERDRARDTAARLEAELARGFRVAAPDVTLSRDNDGPTTPEEAIPGPSVALGRPGSEITSADTHPTENAPESPMGALIPTEPSNNGRSGRRLPIQDASTVPDLTVGPHDVEHLYIWGHDEPIYTIVTPRDET